MAKTVKIVLTIDNFDGLEPIVTFTGATDGDGQTLDVKRPDKQAAVDELSTHHIKGIYPISVLLTSKNPNCGWVMVNGDYHYVCS